MGSTPGYLGQNGVCCCAGRRESTNTRQNDPNNTTPPQYTTHSVRSTSPKPLSSSSACPGSVGAGGKKSTGCRSSHFVKESRWSISPAKNSQPTTFCLQRTPFCPTGHRFLCTCLYRRNSANMPPNISPHTRQNNIHPDPTHKLPAPATDNRTIGHAARAQQLAHDATAGIATADVACVFLFLKNKSESTSADRLRPSISLPKNKTEAAVAQAPVPLRHLNS